MNNHTIITRAALLAAPLAAALAFCCAVVTCASHNDTPDPPPQNQAAPVLTSIEIVEKPWITLYGLNQRFDEDGLQVKGVFNKSGADPDESVQTERLLKASEYTVIPADTSKPGAKNAKVRAGSLEASFTIYVDTSTRVLNRVEMTAPPSKTEYEFGQGFSAAGMALTGHYSEGPPSPVDSSLVIVSGYDRTTRGQQRVTLRVNRDIFPFTVTLKVPASATLKINEYRAVTTTHQEFYRLVHIKGEPMGVTENLRVTVTANGVTDNLTAQKGIYPGDISGYDSARAGLQRLTVTLDNASAGYSVFVADAPPEVYFDYGYMRTAGDPTGTGKGAARYSIPLGRELVIAPTLFRVGANPSYKWEVPAGVAVSGGVTGELLKIAPKAEGSYRVKVTVSAGGASFAAETDVLCTPALPASPPAVVNSAGFAAPLKNFAPGQFTQSGTGYGWSLGAQGGYEIWKLRKENTKKRNLKITGNPMGSWSEPGVVWVSMDENGNGLPDDTWYELKGSDEEDAVYKSLIKRRYGLRYVLGEEGVSQNEFGQIVGRVYWVDARGRTGLIPGGWPFDWGVPKPLSWVTYTGTLLRDYDPPRIDTAEYGGLGDFKWGYVDAWCPVGDDMFNINDAVRLDGTPANLPWIDFVKVQTAAFRYAGIFGEVSTEVKSADGLGAQTDFPSP